MKLSDIACKGAKPKEKAYKIGDGGGLFMQVTPKGAKYWRLKYRFLGKEKLMALGVYPTVTLAEARERREKAKKLLANGLDPMAYKKAAKIEAVRNAGNTFESIAREWHKHKLETWTDKYAQTILNRLEADIFPIIGNMPINEITPPILLQMFRDIESRGVYEITRRAYQYCSQIFRYAIVTGRADRDMTLDLKGALKTKKTKHYAAINVKDLPKLLYDLEHNIARMYPTTILAVKFMLLTFVRTNELINARWDEIDFNNKMWTIPAERMKMGKNHLVPLSLQAIDTLKELERFNGHREWIFASYIKPKQPMSNNTILSALYRMGYKGRMTGHGFRALALTTLIEELSYPFEVADLQLAHAKQGALGAAYDRAQFLDKRKIMMQDWADYIEALGKHGEVVKGHFRHEA